MKKSGLLLLSCILGNGCGAAVTQDEEGIDDVEIGSAAQALSEDDVKPNHQPSRTRRTDDH